MIVDLHIKWSRGCVVKPVKGMGTKISGGDSRLNGTGTVMGPEANRREESEPKRREDGNWWKQRRTRKEGRAIGARIRKEATGGGPTEDPGGASLEDFAEVLAAKNSKKVLRLFEALEEHSEEMKAETDGGIGSGRREGHVRWEAR